jgi:hypothetical protein
VIKVNLWELVRDWIHARYKHVKVIEFEHNSSGATHHLGRIIVKLPKKAKEEIGFAAPKGVIVWPPVDPKNPLAHTTSYSIFKATDPEMFEKMDKILRMYEPKRSK